MSCFYALRFASKLLSKECHALYDKSSGVTFSSNARAVWFFPLSFRESMVFFQSSQFQPS